MRPSKFLQHIVIGATAATFIGAYAVNGDGSVPAVAEAATVIDVPSSTGFLNEAVTKAVVAEEAPGIAKATKAALDALTPSVRKLSHSGALEDAFGSYFAYKARHAEKVRKPYLYFVDYGLPSNQPRGYVFDMEKLSVVRGPFTVAHGSGSARPSELVPKRFSNRHGSNATSLGLYLAQETYGFSGKASGQRYTSIGLRLQGLSKGYNDNARSRGVVAHGAPYVTASRAGRSQGCPAMTQSLARELLPMLANGGMVFLFAPNSEWMAGDPWVSVADAQLESTGTVASTN